MQKAVNFLNDIKAGVFKGNFYLEWIEDDKFKYIPDERNEFKFIRYNGDIIKPKEMKTIGGSTPRLVHVFDKLSLWEYEPAYLINDWEFHAHHKNNLNKSFNEVNLTLAEAIFTLMTVGYKGKILKLDMHVLRAVYLVVMSPICKMVWDGEIKYY
ncbi:MAG: hypothetical protein K8R74_16030 [Bacteroidales bacterium]|nr:hypothetical protein [Bacteroidales bacterium]